MKPKSLTWHTTMIKYTCIAPGHVQNQLIQLVLKTFPDVTVKVSKTSFALDSIYVLIMVSECATAISVHTSNKFISNTPDVELVLWTDIATIPLMHRAICLSKE